MESMPALELHRPPGPCDLLPLPAANRPVFAAVPARRSESRRQSREFGSARIHYGWSALQFVLTSARGHIRPGLAETRKLDLRLTFRGWRRVRAAVPARVPH